MLFNISGIVIDVPSSVLMSLAIFDFRIELRT